MGIPDGIAETILAMCHTIIDFGFLGKSDLRW